MELGISTDFDREFVVIEDRKRSLEQIAAAGFSHIHWCYEWDGEYIYAVSEMKQIREWMDEYGLKAKSLHASKGSSGAGGARIKRHYRKDYTSSLEPNRIAGVELIQNRVELAHIIGATEIVLHMYLPYEEFERNPDYKEIFYGQVYRSLDELMPFCAERNVRICIENLFEAPGELQIEQFTRLCRRYPESFLGLCLDTGHAYLVWGREFVEKLAVPFQDRIYSVHLHDNRGWGDRPGCGDAHRIPEDADFPWKELMPVLSRSAYENPLVLEVSMQAGDEPEDYLKRAYEAGQRLYQLQ
ncbi:sugar phosphate isomerase/epimerase [Acetatifactor muris]|uniref:Endonuclease 4 n=1 Tax=Acetatifactor muris TaxID=879566 RepID=A0A2K4ZGM7_9FIRM|nr:sugar phosphate isomerase/epimerase family protein [Acetatifactor muris]MCR2047812.1 sugar phosphate isomerase/epimerase [Acetatifactor muris]SOY29615.1 endonuclease 4 [Acetatifactor muris]